MNLQYRFKFIINCEDYKIEKTNYLLTTIYYTYYLQITINVKYKNKTININ